jgi:uncharacterized protein YlaI
LTRTGFALIAAATILAACGCDPRHASAPLPDPAVERRKLPAPRFTSSPVVTRSGSSFRISFAVDRETDVAVWIEDASGRVVRHLVAGVLGPNAPPPLAADSLRQSITWDGLNDEGKNALVGSAKALAVRVSLKLSPRLEKIIRGNPADIGGIRGIAPGPDGTVYVFHSYGGHHAYDATTGIVAFTRDGKYKRTVWPFPAELPDSRLRGIRTVQHSTGRSPFIYQFETRSFLPGFGDLPTQRPIVTRDGRIAFVGIQEGPRNFAQPGIARVTVINTDGGVPDAGPLGTLIHPLTDTGASLALSLDEGTLYATGVRAAQHKNPPYHDFVCDNCDHRGATWKHSDPLHAVYRFGWRDRKVRVFVGNPRKAGSGPRELDTPVSVAVDAAGNVYVADFGNGRVSVFDPRGKPLKQISVNRPHRVEVSRKTGAIYVLSGEKLKRGEMLSLVKFDSWQQGNEVTRAKVYRQYWHTIPIRRRTIALDESAEPTIIWFGGPLKRILDRGDEFEVEEHFYAKEWRGQHSIATVMDMSMHRDRGLLYVNNYWRYHTRTGKWDKLNLPGSRMWPYVHPGASNGTAGRDGNYYMDLGGRGCRIFRFDSQMRMLPFPTAEKLSNKPWLEKTDGRLHGSSSNRGRGLTADRNGNVYVIWKKGGRERIPGDYHRANALYVYAPDGTMIARRLVDGQICSISHPRVDPAGNIWLAVGLRPGKDRLPPGLRGRVPAGRRDRKSVNGVNSYPLIYGSIIKFSAKGGKIRVNAGGVRCNYANGRPIDVKGAQWILPGCSVACSAVTPKREPGTIITCICESACIDVDDFGRCFFPDAGRSRIGVADTAGNVIAWIGQYGNQDSQVRNELQDQRPSSANPQSYAPLCWPQAVAADDTHVYIGDRLNRRILAVALSYTQTVLKQLPPE